MTDKIHGVQLPYQNDIVPNPQDKSLDNFLNGNASPDLSFYKSSSGKGRIPTNFNREMDQSIRQLDENKSRICQYSAWLGYHCMREKLETYMMAYSMAKARAGDMYIIEEYEEMPANGSKNTKNYSYPKSVKRFCSEFEARTDLKHSSVIIRVLIQRGLMQSSSISKTNKDMMGLHIRKTMEDLEQRLKAVMGIADINEELRNVSRNTNWEQEDRFEYFLKKQAKAGSSS